MSELRAQSGFGANTKEPFVSLHHQDWCVQVTPAQARHWAMSILECAEAAEQDAFIVDHMQKIGLNYEQALLLLRDYRLWREKKQQARDPK